MGANTYDTHTNKADCIPFKQEVLDRIKEIKTRFPEGKHKSALLPTLHLAQKENGGWLSVAVMDYVASLLDITPIEVYEVASFYTMFNLRPVGKHVLEFCHTGPCCTRNAEKMLAYLEEKTNCKAGHTSPDGLFTIKRVECLGACGYAPVLQLGDSFREHLDETRIDNLIAELKNK